MKAIRVHKFGAPEVLQVDEIPIPEPTEDQVLVKLHSAGINPVETYQRSGAYPALPTLPWTPGQEGAGEVVKTGSAVSNVKKGEKVWLSSSVSGTYAQYCTASASAVHPLPSHLSYDQGAAVWIAYGTAYFALHVVGRAQPKSKIFIHGASGGVGTAALQLARRVQDSLVIGTASTESGKTLALSNGASHVFNHKEPGYMDEVMKATGGNGIDVILEMLANVNLGNDLKILAKYGRVIVVGSRGNVEISPRDLMGKRASIHGVALQSMTPEERKEIINVIEEGLNDTSPNGLAPQVGKSFKLADIVAAHHEIINPPKQGGAKGKLVLHPWE